MRQQKEKEKQRRSMLIFGTQDMKKKLFERENQKHNKQNNVGHVNSNNSQSQVGRSLANRSGPSNQSSDDGQKQKKSCKERMKFVPRSPFLTFWDGVMLAIIVYSCFSSMYFAAIEFDICNNVTYLNLVMDPC